MKKEGDIRRFSAAELEARHSRGESRTDMARLRGKSDEQIEREIANDPDFRDEPEDWLARAEAVMPTPKKLLSLRIDNDVLEWFKRQGPGYQTRINAVLRAFIEQADKRRA